MNPVGESTELSPRLVTVFPNITITKNGEDVTLQSVIDRIRSPEFKPACEQVQEAYRQGGKDGKDAAKKVKAAILPYVTLAATFKHRNNEGASRPAESVHGDLDELPPEELERVSDCLRIDPHTEYLFISPSGNGLKFGFQIPPTDTADQYKARWRALNHYMCKHYSVELDSSVSDISHPCFLSHDPTAYYNPEANVFMDIREEQKKPPTDEPVGDTDESNGHMLDDAELIKRMLNATNGAKARKLWVDGDYSGYERYDQHGTMINDGESEADVALCCILAFWTDKDAERMDRLFKQSKLYRPERWNRADYAKRTIRYAIAQCAETYSGKARPDEATADKASNGTDNSKTVEIYANNPSHIIVDMCADALATLSDKVFQRNGHIVVLAKQKSIPRNDRAVDETLRIIDAEVGHIYDELSRTVRYFSINKEGEPVLCHMPEKYAKRVISRTEHPYRILIGHVTTPTLRHDGSVITKPGYDVSTGLYYQPTTEYPPMLEHPTKDDARKAYKSLKEPFKDFPFADKERDTSASISATLTIEGRHLTRTTPQFAVGSTTSGAGKGLLVDTICVIATNAVHAISTLPRDDEKANNLLYSIAASGQRVTIFDNISGMFGSDALDAVLTKPWVSTRKFHAQETVQAELQNVFFITGNNLRFRGDLVRRTIPITLLPTEQNPEKRTNFTHKNLIEWTRKNHPRLLVDALTILRAYILAGKPSQNVTYGSFEEWSDLVRSALIWIGATDPCEGREVVESEADDGLEALSTLLNAWFAAYPNGQKYSLSDLVENVQREDRKKIQGEPKNQADETILAVGKALTAYDVKSNGRIGDLNNRRLSQTLPLYSGQSRRVGDFQLKSNTSGAGGTRQFWVEKIGTTQNEPKDSDDTGLAYEGPDDDLPF